ncbi:MAG: agmatinase [Firmicutes bacterium]|nr:agmatinase [Bacillota bacterium]
MLNKFICCEKPLDKAKVVLFGSPFDGTTSYRPGTRLAPDKIRSESFGIETYSPYLDKDLEDCNICDIGDLDLPFGNTTKVLDMVEAKTAEILASNKLPVMLGGEHLITLGSFKACLKKYSDLMIVHFDAHTDLRESYIGEKLSHSTVIKRCYDEIQKESDNKKKSAKSIRIFQFGIRSGERYEFEFASKNTYLCKNDFSGLDKILPIIKDKPVYLTVDLDVLDPSEFPGTGTPEAGGVRFLELLTATQKIFANSKVVMADIVELNPMVDPSGISTALACKYLREILLQMGIK